MRARESMRRWWLLLAVAVAWGEAAWAQTGNLAKIDPELQELMHQSRDANETFRVIIEMTEQYDNPNLERGTVLMTRAQRRDYVVNELKRFSESSQAEMVGFLTAQGTRGQVNVLHRFWIFNGVCCEATASCIGELSTRQDVRFVSLDTEKEMIEPEEETISSRDNPPEGVQWHVSKVQADRVWNEKNIKGRGVVVAILDSGVNYNHPDIINNMWVWYVDENQNPVYGWDFYNDDSDPMDDNGHGTNVAGITASNGATYQMGIAPNASIMALKVLNSHGSWRGWSSVCSAVEFAVEHGADVLNLSIGEYGVGGVELFRNTFVNVMNAGIVASVAGGNAGDMNEYPVPYNIGAPGNCPPPWHNPNQVSFSIGDPSAVICVGNTNQNDIRYYESSIGPVTWSMGSYIGDYNDYLFFPESPTDISGLVRPDVSAPGTNIWSLAHDYDGQNNQNNPYSRYTGTSQSAPCVAGVIALMLEANPNLTPAKIDSILETTAVACDGQTLKNNEYGAGRVDAFAAVTAALNTHLCEINAVPIPASGGTVSGSGTYLAGNLCTLTATPNSGYAFLGWFNSMDMMVSPNPNYTFTVQGNRYLIAKFALRDYTITLDASPSAGGSVSGGGTYPAGRTVTITAAAALGYYFNGWMENGMVVNTQPNYTFTITSDRNLTAIFSTNGPQIFDGNVVTNPDGSKGVVFYTNPLGTGGTMVALEDASESCPWGESDDIHAMRNHGFTQFIPDDRNGYVNTLAILNQQGVGTGYAADVVDFAHGWYLPSANQLRKLYSALPFIEDAIEAEGGTTLATSNYWSSTEASVTEAWDPSFAMSVANKTSNLRVRAVRDFSYDGNFMVTLSEVGTGMVVGAGVYPSGMGVTVTAIPASGYVFRCWTENGIEVSYDAEYTFNVYSHRNLEAHFSIENSIGSVITNADGSQGVVFWLSPNGNEGLMVALEDASEGCQWGETTDAFTLSNKPYNNVMALTDVSGNGNTRGIRKHQGTDNNYAASLVDFDNGWYLPSVGELRKLYAALPMIETALVHAGGSTLTEDIYWSSTEYSRSDAATATFSMGNTGKTNTCRVRAIRHFATAGPNAITAKPNDSGFGTALGSGEYNYGQNVIVRARANPGYSFNAWKENGMVVSYDSIYQFPFTRSRSLVADFGKSGHVGSIVHNDDGSVGIVFYKYPIGEGGLMVALEDASEGCPWGLNEDVSILQNWSPDAVAELLKDMNGKNNTMRIRAWYDNNTDYAAGKVDYDNGWFLPSAGQLRKLYAALPMIEGAIIQAGGSTLTEGTYWSSTEQSASNAWTPSFAMNSTNKTNNCRVRAIRSLPNTTYTIQVTANIQGGGTTAGSGVYDYGQLCTLKAAANPTYAFQGWKKNGVIVSTNMDYSFTVTSDQTYVACFVENSSNITTSADPSWMGTASGTGIYTIGSTCTLTAIPNQGYSFVNWTKGGSVVSTNPSYSFTVTESASYCAHFVITSYTINATANPTGGGTVSGTGSYNESVNCTLTATANTGYTFLRWTENGQQVSTNPSYTFTVTRNRTLVAQFQPLSYTISASANPSNGGTVNGGGAYDYGTTCTVTATPASGYYFMNWTKDGEVVSINTSYSFTVTRDAVLVANFTTTRYTVTVASSDPSQGTVGGGGAFVYGHTCTVTATPAEGYYFINWTQNGEVVSTTETYTFTVEANTTLVAHFSAGSVIGDGGTAINSYLPSYSFYKYTLSQQIYTAEELGSAGFITSIAFYNGGATKTRSYDFYMKATTKNTFSSTTDWETVTAYDKVFNGSVTMVADGWTLISFDTPFVYDGSSNVVLVTSDISGEYTGSPYMTCRVFTAAGNQSIYAYRDGSEAYNPASPSSYSGTLVSVKNQLRFTKVALGDCMPPTLLTATEVGAHFVELSWTELGTSEQWVVYYNNQWTTASTNENFRLEGLDSETEYTIKVRPVCDDDLWSTTITVTTLEACPAPRNVDVGNITPVAATVIWDGYSDSYNVQVGRTNIVLHVEEFSDGIPADWNNTSNYPWTVVDGHIQSGNGGYHSTTSEISVTVNFPDDGIVEFDAECKGEGSSTYYDHCDFYVDGTRMLYVGANISGWNHYSYAVTAGVHTFKWSYTKDSTTHPTGDYFAVDNVEMKMGEIVWNAPVSVWNDVYSFTGLNPATTYCVRVQGVCGAFETEWSEDVFFTTLEGSTVYTFTKEIDAYTADGGYYLIAVPLDEVNPEEVEHMLDNTYDLYEYDEAETLEWRNHKDNAFNLQLGKGYLYANSEDVILTFTGMPNSNNCMVTLKKTSDAETAGWNLVGNPFNQRAYLNRDFYVMNGYGSEIIAAQRNYIEPMEGVFVVANYNGESLTFTQAKSANDDKRIVINLSQDLGTTIIDRAIVRFGEGSGLPKFQINESSTKLFIQQDGKDYAVVCAKEQGEIPINFKASEDGAYTLTVSGTLNSMLSTLNFSYLHLIDNFIGKDIDLLATPSYTFEAKTTDSASRFVLVIRTSM